MISLFPWNSEKRKMREKMIETQIYMLNKFMKFNGKIMKKSGINLMSLNIIHKHEKMFEK